MTLTLRPSARSDFDIVASWISTADECHRWAGPSMPYPFSGAELPRLIANSPSMVASETKTGFALTRMGPAAEEVLAYGELVRENSASFRLARIIVAPDQRGRGLGDAFCRLLIEYAKAHAEPARFRLFVYRDNASALSLYRRLGFVEAPPHPRAEILAMEKRVTEAGLPQSS